MELLSMLVETKQACTSTARKELKESAVEVLNEGGRSGFLCAGVGYGAAP